MITVFTPIQAGFSGARNARKPGQPPNIRQGVVSSLITWDRQTIGRYIDASSYTGFHKALAQKIVPYLEPEDRLLDLGCGLGKLDIEMAPYVSDITAVDISDSAISALRRDITLSGLKNLHARRCDVSKVTGRFDVVFLSFFGRPKISDLLDLCNRRIIRIVSAGKKSALYPEKRRRKAKIDVTFIQEELLSLGIDHKMELCSLEFGQPLRTRRDAELFVLSNAPESEPEEINDFLSENLEHTGREDFPFYLPYRKELGIFVIDKDRDQGLGIRD